MKRKRAALHDQNKTNSLNFFIRSVGEARKFVIKLLRLGTQIH